MMWTFPFRHSIQQRQTTRHVLLLTSFICVALLLFAAVGPIPARADAPIAVPDSDSTDEDTPFVTVNVLDNDTDPDGDTLTVTDLDTAGTLGLVTNNDDGTFGYDPNGQFGYLAVGESTDDAFIYTVSDGNDGTDSTTVTITITGRNDIPSAVNDQGADFTTDEDTAFTTTNVLNNDTDPDSNDTLSVISINTTGTIGLVTDIGDGTFTYDPDNQFHPLSPGDTVEDTFTYTVDDGHGGTATAAVHITIQGVNDAPWIGPPVPNQAADEDEDIFIPLSEYAHDMESSGPDLDWTVSGEEYCTVSGENSDNDELTFTPLDDFFGPDSVLLTLTDAHGGTATQTIVLTWNSVNDPPSAEDDVDSTDADAVLNQSAPGVLANDKDTEDDPLTVASYDATSAQGAAVFVDAGGGYTYDPTGSAALQALAGGESISDTFGYTVIDGNNGAATATVHITVQGINHPPIARDDSGKGFAIDEDTPLTTSNVLDNDHDPDKEDSLSVANFDASATIGSVMHNGDGTFVYNPDRQFEHLSTGEQAIDTFAYTVSDTQGLTDTATVHITIQGVNDDPTVQDDTGSTEEDIPLNVGAPGVLGNDTDPEGDPLSVTGYDATSDQGATVIVNADGSYFYDPTGSIELQALAVGEDTVDTFGYVVSDGNGGLTVAIVHVTVTGVNDRPIADDDQGFGYSTNEDTPFDTANVLLNDHDPDTNDSLSVSDIDTAGMLGRLTDNHDGTFVYDPNGQFEALGTNQQAIETFTYTVRDEQGSTDTATVSITVVGINDAPIATDNDFLVQEDSQNNPLYPLVDDTDVEGNDLTIISATSPMSGTVAITEGGAALAYTPNPDFYGFDRFSYTISDGNGGSATAEITIQVDNVNDAPRAQADFVDLDEDSGANVLYTLANDSYLPDPEETLVIVSATPADFGTLSIAIDGSYLTYIPDPNYYGTDLFTYTIIDGNGGTATAEVNVIVHNVNDNPLADSDYITITEDSTNINIYVLENDTYLPDPIETLTITKATNGAHGDTRIGEENDRLIYTPDPDYYGEDTLTYTIADGNGGFDTGTVTVQVENVNDDPLARRDAAEVDEDSGINEIDVLINDTYQPDPWETLTVVGVTRPQYGTAHIVAGGSQLTYQPNADFSGNDVFAYTISDGNGGYDTTQVDVAVTGINDHPVAEDDSAATDEDTSVIIDVLANDSDIDGELVPSTVQVTTAPTHGSTSVNDSNGQVTYTPDPDWNGHDSFEYQICDNGTPLPAQCDIARVDVSVGPVNDLPVSNAGPDQTVDTLTTVTLDGSASYDPDGHLPLTYQWSYTAEPSHIAITLNGAGSVAPSFTAPDEPAVLTFSLRVIDALNQADLVPDEAVVTVTNQPPVADAGPDQRALVGTTVTLDGSGSYDPDDPSGKRKLIYKWTQTGGAPVDLSDDSIPSPIFEAPDDPTVLTFVLTVSDAFRGRESDQVVITIHEPYFVYMPLVAQRPAPDLVVRSITVTSDNVQLVIENQGNAPVQDDFWVDAYIDPSIVPTGVNQPFWYWDLDAQGMAWWVSGNALAALGPGGSITLDRYSESYAASESNVTWPLPAGTTLYAQVDSYNPDNIYRNDKGVLVPYGQVLETHEIFARPYNNIHGPVN